MIKGFIETSFVDWPGRSCAVVFTGGCNFRCPFCHNHPLVTRPQEMEDIGPEKVLSRLEGLKKWLGGVCVTGGEPTLHKGLPGLLARLKGAGFAVKLDSNGTNPGMLAELIGRGLVDMIDMDVKAPLDDEEAYARAAGVRPDLAAVRESVSLLAASPVPHRFRMTVVPGLHRREDIRRWRAGLPPGAEVKLQNFRPGETLDPSFSSLTPFTAEEFAGLQAAIAS